MNMLGDAQTDEERCAEAAIAAVPEWRGLAIRYWRATPPVMSPSHRAVDSLCFAIDVGVAPERLFLKVLHPDLWPTVDIDAAFEAARLAAQLGVTPAPRRLIAAQRAIVFDRLDEGWRTARMDDLGDEFVLAKVIAAKKTINGGPAFGRDWTIFDGVRRIEADLASAAAEVSADAWWMRDAVDDIEKAVVAAGWDSKPCHGDGLASNVMIGPSGAIQLVDFDNACNADPYFDLGILLNEAFVFESEMLAGLEEFDGSLRPQSLNRCRLYGIADDFYWGLWASYMNVVSARTSVEFLKYSQWRLLRCRMAICDARFEAMLRHL